MDSFRTFLQRIFQYAFGVDFRNERNRGMDRAKLAVEIRIFFLEFAQEIFQRSQVHVVVFSDEHVLPALLREFFEGDMFERFELLRATCFPGELQFRLPFFFVLLRAFALAQPVFETSVLRLAMAAFFRDPSDAVLAASDESPDISSIEGDAETSAMLAERFVFSDPLHDGFREGFRQAIERRHFDFLLFGVL